MVAISPTENEMRILGKKIYNEGISVGKKEENVLKSIGFDESKIADVKEQLKTLSGDFI